MVSLEVECELRTSLFFVMGSATRARLLPPEPIFVEPTLRYSRQGLELVEQRDGSLVHESDGGPGRSPAPLERRGELAADST